jgi:hypothetical protein
LEIVPHLHRRDPQSTYALFRNPGVAARIATRLIAIAVPFSVDLDGQARALAIEVEDIGPERVLSAKLQSAERPLPQSHP